MAIDSDIVYMNSKLGLEHEMVAVYQKCTETQLLSPGMLTTAASFRGHHEQHRDAIVAAIRNVGGTPVAAQPSYDLLTSANGVITGVLGQWALTGERDLVVLLMRLEDRATKYAVGSVSSVGDKTLKNLLCTITPVDAQHTAALRMVLKEDPAPQIYVG